MEALILTLDRGGVLFLRVCIDGNENEKRISYTKRQILCRRLQKMNILIWGKVTIKKGLFTNWIDW